MRFKATKHQPIAGFKRDLNSGAFISTTRSNRPLKVQLKTQEQRLVMLEEQVKLLQVLVNEFNGVTPINKATKSKKGEINA
jgi:hypothetical protein